MYVIDKFLKKFSLFSVARPVGLCVLVLAMPALVQAEQLSNSQSDGFEKRNFVNWTVFAKDTPMSDGSMLREYIAASDEVEGQEGENSSNGQLQFIFHPRFLCSPLIRIIGSELPSKEQDAPDSSDISEPSSMQLTLLIDGEPVDFPALVEESAQRTEYFYNVNLQRRATLRILVELGIEMSITYPGGDTAVFSLKGSQKALQIASSSCRQH